MKKNKIRLLLVLWLSAVLMFVFPLLGAWMAGRSPVGYLSFGPRTRLEPLPPFNWFTCMLLGGVVVVIMVPLLFQWLRSQNSRGARASSYGSIPWWGWAALLLGAVSWTLAWTRFSWFQPFQRLTFFPLWLSYILGVNAWTSKRSGRCMLTDRSIFFLSLFIASAIFWWLFEYLNRFVNNWFYVGTGRVTAVTYVVLSGIPFSTVLPAVCGTCGLLETFPGAAAGMDRFVRMKFKNPTWGIRVVFFMSLFVLAGIGYRPDQFFPFLWLGPLMLLSSTLNLAGEKTLFADVETGDWSRIWLMGVSALICGFFWEMWNYYSLARWEYAIPYAAGFYIFEMPLLGYAGYLSFGLECALMADVTQRLIE